MGFSLVWDICRSLLAHFPVLGCPENRGNAVQILTKLYIFGFQIGFSENVFKTDFGRRPYRSVGPSEMQTNRSDRTLRH
ncbi:proline-rich receptor-like protein kinase PERK2 [Iris pallida]|uniref:Proline-rich receptor-like protein kinase PERK2 n=1 Tax=Iris pallida TaxID=29817 RepID=A0AAX6ILS3_IRIPA|nr:proline-rich receptor-like protein kinase PERK2 [Iris pallida]